jgi:hypothetical protein
MSEAREVERWEPMFTPNLKTGRNDYDGMMNYPEGGYVEYTDYASLLSELASLREYARKSDEANTALKTMCAAAESEAATLRATINPNGIDSKLIEAQAEIATQEADARRYRWLRQEVDDAVPFDRPVIFVHESSGDGRIHQYVLSDADADEHIDRAIDADCGGEG